MPGSVGISELRYFRYQFYCTMKASSELAVTVLELCSSLIDKFFQLIPMFPEFLLDMYAFGYLIL